MTLGRREIPDHHLGRRALFFGLYACEGAPIGFVWWALPAELRSRGVAVESITALTALLVLPWTFKFLWAPLVDAATRRARALPWVIGAAQLGMLTTLAPLCWLDLSASFEAVRLLLVLHAVFGATQDVGIDALAIRCVPKEELGPLNGWMQAGMLVGRSIFGSGALILAERLGFSTLVAGMCVWLVVLGSLALLFRPPPEAAAPERVHLMAELRKLLTQPNTWYGLGIALTAGAAFEAVGALAGVLLIDAGYSRQDVGVLLFLPAVAAMLVGSLVGGALSARISARKTTGAFVVFVAIATGALASSMGAPLLALVSIYFGLGGLTAASYAFFMELTSPRLAATQFSAFMGATNGCESWSAYSVGRLVHAQGYPVAFTVMAAASLLSLPLLWRARPDVVAPSPER